MRTRAVLADDHPLVTEGIHRILEDQAIELIATVQNGRDLVNAVAENDPDLVILDISMPELNGIEAARQIHATSSRSKIIFVSMHSDPAYVQEAVHAGADAYVLKRSAKAELATAITEVLAGRAYFSPLVGAAARTKLPGNGRFAANLTSRQREVLQLIAEGKTAKEMAHLLGISVKTVEFHKAGLNQALGLHTTAELTRYAIEQGVVGGSLAASS